MSDVRRYRGLSDAQGPFADSFVLASDYDAAVRRAEEAEAKLAALSKTTQDVEQIKPPPRIIRAWIGFTDDKPYVFRNDHGQDEWCVFTNRKHARQAFVDVRRCDIVIKQSTDRGSEHG